MKLIIGNGMCGWFSRNFIKKYGKMLFVMSLYFCPLHFFAQIKGTSISGSVIDKSSKSLIEFANVQLLNASDSTVVNATASDKKGRFILSDVANGNYILGCTFISHEKVYQLVSVAGQQKINVGTIEISEVSKNMKEVVVTSKRSMLNTGIDRKIYNVGEDIMSQSGSVSDILKNVPSVEVDIDGGVSLRGSSEVMILINGKPSPLMGKSKADVLQQIPANSIERIEIITNPSARFKPDGTSGIINIVMKKNIKSGWNGTIVANLGNHNRYGGSANLNYKTDKVTVYGSYGIRKDNRIRINEIDRQTFDATQHLTVTILN